MNSKPKINQEEKYELYCTLNSEKEWPKIRCNLHYTTSAGLLVFSDTNYLNEEEMKRPHHTFYRILKKGMQKAHELGVKKIECIGNDKKVMSQLNGEIEPPDYDDDRSLLYRFYEIKFWEKKFEEATFRYLTTL